jgi:aryl-alcohol dehydrogenase-like predicted oxidoreductase
MRGAGRADARGLPYYNLMNRMPEVEILPACDYHGIGVAPYSRWRVAC